MKSSRSDRELELDDGVHVRVLSGQFDDVTGPVAGVAVQPLYLDIELPAGTDLSPSLPENHTAFLYVFEGDLVAGASGETVRKHELAVLGTGTEVPLVAGNDGARTILVAGRPLGEPVARYGPFVMNTREELQQAFADYAAKRF